MNYDYSIGNRNYETGRSLEILMKVLMFFSKENFTENPSSTSPLSMGGK